MGGGVRMRGATYTLSQRTRVLAGGHVVPGPRRGWPPPSLPYSWAVQLHLAQYNTATLVRPLDHPASASYVELLDEVNALADASPGFVWRHGIDSRDPSTSVYDDPLRLVNASVWESLEALRDYAYKGLHRDVFRRRREWFRESGAVMWWIPAGTIPTLEECVQRLDFLHRHGASPYGFETGQKHPTLVMVSRAVDTLDADGLDAAPFSSSCDVQVAVLDGRVVGAAQLVDADVVVRTVDGVDLSWLEPALETHARALAG